MIVALTMKTEIGLAFIDIRPAIWICPSRRAGAAIAIAVRAATAAVRAGIAAARAGSRRAGIARRASAAIVASAAVGLGGIGAGTFEAVGRGDARFMTLINGFTAYAVAGIWRGANAYAARAGAPITAGQGCITGSVHGQTSSSAAGWIIERRVGVCAGDIIPRVPGVPLHAGLFADPKDGIGFG